MTYQLKIVVQEDKVDEFFAALCELSCDFRKKRGCLSYDVYKGVKQENIFCIICELKSANALNEHFRSRNFEVLLGAARTLGKDFKITIANEVQTGNYELAKSKLISSKPIYD